MNALEKPKGTMGRSQYLLNRSKQRFKAQHGRSEDDDQIREGTSGCDETSWADSPRNNGAQTTARNAGSPRYEQHHNPQQHRGEDRRSPYSNTSTKVQDYRQSGQSDGADLNSSNNIRSSTSSPAGLSMVLNRQSLEEQALHEELERQRYEHQQQQLHLRQEQLRQQEQLRWQQHQLHLQQEQLRQQEQMRQTRQQQQIRNQKVHHQQRQQFFAQQKQIREQQEQLEQEYQQQQQGLKQQFHMQQLQQERFRQKELRKKEKKERQEQGHRDIRIKIRKGWWNYQQQLLKQEEDDEESVNDLHETISTQSPRPKLWSDTTDISIYSSPYRNSSRSRRKGGVTLDISSISEALTFLDRASRLQVPEHLANALEKFSSRPHQGSNEHVVRRAIAVRQEKNRYGSDFGSLQKSYSPRSITSSGYSSLPYSRQPGALHNNNIPRNDGFGGTNLRNNNPQSDKNKGRRNRTSATSVSSSSSSSRSLQQNSTITTRKGIFEESSVVTSTYETAKQKYENVVDTSFLVDPNTAMGVPHQMEMATRATDEIPPVPMQALSMSDVYARNSPQQLKIQALSPMPEALPKKGIPIHENRVKNEIPPPSHAWSTQGASSGNVPIQALSLPDTHVEKGSSIPIKNVSTPFISTSTALEKERPYAQAETPLHRNINRVMGKNDRDQRSSPSFGLSPASRLEESNLEEVGSGQIGTRTSPHSSVEISRVTSIAEEDLSFPSLKITEAFTHTSRDKGTRSRRSNGPSPSPSDVLMTYTVTENDETSGVNSTSSNKSSRSKSGITSIKSQHSIKSQRSAAVRNRRKQPPTNHSRAHKIRQRMEGYESKSSMTTTTSESQQKQPARPLQPPSSEDFASHPPILPPSSGRSLLVSYKSKSRSRSKSFSSSETNTRDILRGPSQEGHDPTEVEDSKSNDQLFDTSLENTTLPSRRTVDDYRASSALSAPSSRNGLSYDLSGALTDDFGETSTYTDSSEALGRSYPSIRRHRFHDPMADYEDASNSIVGETDDDSLYSRRSQLSVTDHSYLADDNYRSSFTEKEPDSVFSSPYHQNHRRPDRYHAAGDNDLPHRYQSHPTDSSSAIPSGMDRHGGISKSSPYDSRPRPLKGGAAAKKSTKNTTPTPARHHQQQRQRYAIPGRGVAGDGAGVGLLLEHDTYSNVEDDEDLDKWLESAMASKSTDDGGGGGLDSNAAVRLGADTKNINNKNNDGGDGGDEADLDAWLDNVIRRR